jgi:putative phosphoribosyl transferase
MRFQDRDDAGRALARLLTRYAGRSDVLVLGLPRGGVPVASQIATALNAPLDVLVVRKLGVPSQPELAMGAIASGGIRVTNDDVVSALGIDRATLDAVAEREGLELERRERAYRGDRPSASVEGRTVIVVDDGLATGSTMRAAIEALRTRRPARIIVAVPVAVPQVRDLIGSQADEVVCAMAPEQLSAVGLWYEDFQPVADDEVTRLLAAAPGDYQA